MIDPHNRQNCNIPDPTDPVDDPTKPPVIHTQDGVPLYYKKDDQGFEYYVGEHENIYENNPDNIPYFDYIERLWNAEQEKIRNPVKYYQNASMEEIARDFTPRVFLQLAIKADEGNVQAIKEFHRLTMPAKGLNDRVSFELPPDFDQMNAGTLKVLQKEMFRALGAGLMSLEQFKDLSVGISNMIQTTEIAELEDKIDSLTEIIEGDDEESDALVVLDDYRSLDDLSDEDKKRFESTAANAVIVGSHAAKEMSGNVDKGREGGNVE